MVTPRELEDLLRRCEERGQIRRTVQDLFALRYPCSCGRVHTHLTDLYVCSASHDDDA